MKKKDFKYDEFKDLFSRATAECLRVAKAKYCEGPVFDKVFYIISGHDQDFKSQEEALTFIFKDGKFRSTIRLAPIANTTDATIIEISWGDDVMDSQEWTNKIHTSALSFRYEPFTITGPPLPQKTSWEDVKKIDAGVIPWPKIRLPLWQPKKPQNTGL